MNYVCGPVDDRYNFEIKIDPNRPVGIMLSGGLDSSILLMLLASIVSSEQIVIFTVPRADNAYYHAQHLIKSINNHYHLNFKQPCMVSNGQGYHGTQVFKGITESLSMYNDIQLFLAENTPPAKTEIDIAAAYPVRAKDPDQIPNVYMPFWAAKKYHLIDIALQNKWHKLFEFTHSCCVWPVGRCNACFNCKEREWAFDKLGVADPGLI